jgi:hypothetical protein
MDRGVILVGQQNEFLKSQKEGGMKGILHVKLAVFCFLLIVFFVLFVCPSGFLMSQSPTLVLPDLLLSDISVVDGCRVKVRIASQGRVVIPDSAYHRTEGVVLQLYKDGAAWGGLRLFAVDPDRKLQKISSGRVVEYVYRVPLEPGSHSVRAVIDSRDCLEELNEDNNDLTRRAACIPDLPDLVIEEIRILEGCRVFIKLKNIGRAPLTRAAYYGSRKVWLYLYKNNSSIWRETLINFDPSRRLARVGGVAGAQYQLSIGGGTFYLKAVIDKENYLEEIKERNNTKVMHVRNLICNK